MRTLLCRAQSCAEVGAVCEVSGLDVVAAVPGRGTEGAGRGLAVRLPTGATTAARSRSWRPQGWQDRPGANRAAKRNAAICRSQLGRVLDDRLYLNPGEDALALGTYEKTGTQAREYSAPDMPEGVRDGLAFGRPRDLLWRRHGPRGERINSVTFTPLPGSIAVAPDLEVHVVIDSGSSHTCRAAMSPPEVGSAFRAHYTPNTPAGSTNSSCCSRHS